MDTRDYLELFFNDTSNPCYFAELETHNIAFINKVMEKKIRAYDDVVGKKCYAVLHNRDTPCNFCPMENLKPSEFLEQRIFNEVTRNYHRANSTVITVNEKEICACKYFVAFTQEKKVYNTIPYDDAIAKCLDILNRFQIEDAIVQLLALMGEFYKGEQCFIYELDPDKQVLASKCTWKKDENMDEIPEVEDLALVQQFLQWLDHMDGDITEITTSTSYLPNSIEERLLFIYNIKSLAVNPIKNRIGKVIGFVGISNRKIRDFDKRLMKTISRFVEERNSTQIALNELKSASELDGQTGFYNRKRYMEYLREMDDNMPQSLGVVFVHMTNLREVNEKLGFGEGNEQISKTADYIRTHFTEPFYRITGDEFLCFLPECSEGDLYQRIAKLEDEIHLGTGPVMQVGCAWSNENINVLELVAEADGNVKKS